MTAAPVDGAANDAVLRALAEAFDVPRRVLRIASGDASKNKAVVISGVEAAIVQARLARLENGP